jgi:hypothetical protein
MEDLYRNSKVKLKLKLHKRMEIESIGQSLGHFDLIVSAWTFLHLTDPFGTLYHLFASLNDGGFILFDGFGFCRGEEAEFAKDLCESRALFKSVFEKSNANFLGYECELEYARDHFLLQKVGRDNLEIPIEYSPRGDVVTKDWEKNSCVTEVARYVHKHENPSNAPSSSYYKVILFGEDQRPRYRRVYYGSRDLLELFLQNKIAYTPLSHMEYSIEECDSAY